jgi:predicted PurR-regulated permease PerM
MKVKIDIDTRTFVRFWLVVIAFALAALFIIGAQTALAIIGVSMFFALALNVPVSKIARRLPGKSRVGATAIAYAAVIIALGTFIFLVIPPVVEQTIRLIQNLPKLIESATSQWSGVNDLIDQYGVRDQVNQALVSMQESLSTWATNASKTIVVTIGSFFSFITAAILVLVLTFLMLVEAPVWTKRLWNLYNNKTRMLRHRRLADGMYNVFTGYVTGQLTVSAIGATCAALLVFILSFIFPSVPSSMAMPTAAITFLLSMIPMFGATIGGVIISILLLLSEPAAAVVYIIYFVIYQQVENNFISPNIQGKKIDLSALAVLISVTIGLYAGGIVGGIIAIPIAGSIRVLAEEYFANAKKRRASSDKTAEKLLKDFETGN